MPQIVQWWGTAGLPGKGLLCEAGSARQCWRCTYRISAGHVRAALCSAALGRVWARCGGLSMAPSKTYSHKKMLHHS